MDSSRRQRWTEESRRRKQPSLYDEWLNEERSNHQINTTTTPSNTNTPATVAQQAPPPPPPPPPHSTKSTSAPASAHGLPSHHTPLRRGGDTTAATSTTPSSGATIRTITPDIAGQQDGAVAGRGNNSFERAFVQQGVAASSSAGIGEPIAMDSSPSGASLTGRAKREREGERERERDNDESERDWEGKRTRDAAQRSTPASRNGNSSMSMVIPMLSTNGRGTLARSSSRGNPEHANATPNTSRDAYPTARPRTRTLDERRTRDRSPTNYKHRHRIASVNNPASPMQGVEYLASMPAATSPPSAPSISTLGSPVLTSADLPSQRSISPTSSSTADSSSSVPSATARRRILHLMKTLNGKMSGNAVFRAGYSMPWSQAYCYIQDESGSLMYESRIGENVERTLIPDLRGCKVNLDVDGETPYIEICPNRSNPEVHIKLSNQADFDAWFAALLFWQALEPTPPPPPPPQQQPLSEQRSLHRMAPISTPSGRPDPPPRISSARSLSQGMVTRRERSGSEQANRRKSGLTSLREAPVIKIGKMIFWDTNVTYNNNASASVGLPATGRPQAYRMQSYGSRRWRRISGQLRENGELKLHSDADNTLISVVQLSQLSRCAIQRLDTTVLDNEFCIAIYPQYTSSPSSNVSFLRPIFLSLDNRVLFEVWFVLLRAFTIPQLYGPRLPKEMANVESDNGQDLENLLATTTTDMFRMERALNIRVVEAKMYPPTAAATSPDSGFSGGHGRGVQVRPEQFGYHVEVLLDGETRGKTAVKYEGLQPLWGETFEFLDLPPVLTSASVVIKRRPPEYLRAQEQQHSKLVHEAYGFSGDQNGGYTGLTFDTTCGKVEIYLEELAAESEVEKWWPVVNMYNQRVGEVLIKARAEEGVILMSRDYRPLNDILHRFSNGLTLQMARMIPNELKRLSDCLLNIFQVSGRVSDWLMALVEDEIDSIHKETPTSRLRYNKRSGSDGAAASRGGGGDGGGSGGEGSGPSSHLRSDRELVVRDMNKNATLEANLLFRGNTLLTKSLDSHMRRIGREYLEEALGARLKEINDKDPDCEVDPNRAGPGDVERNWRRLLHFTQEVWKSIVAAKAKCPLELRVLFRHIRACAEDRYGDFLRSVSYSSVSGFLFLRFFCPAVLNPKLFGLLKDDIKPRARRALTLIAKSLQTLANMASFGTKEHWMEPMNVFLTQHREGFKSLIDDVCYIPTPISSANFGQSTSTSSSVTTNVVSTEQHLSYTTPMTIMQRLPPTSREGFPSLPYLIDQARAFADLVQLWLESTSQTATTHEFVMTGKTQPTIASVISGSDSELKRFHDIATALNHRTQECLSRAERAERPNSALSFRWEELIDQLQSPTEPDEGEVPSSPFGLAADRIASDPTIVPSSPPQHPSRLEGTVTSLRTGERGESEDDELATRMYESTPPHSGSTSNFDLSQPPERSGDANNTRGAPPVATFSPRDAVTRVRRHQQEMQNYYPPARASVESPPPGAALPLSATASNVSSAVSSDAEHNAASNTTTALPSYEREVLRNNANEQQHHHHLSQPRQGSSRTARQQRERERERVRESEKEKEKARRKEMGFFSGLKKMKEKEAAKSSG